MSAPSLRGALKANISVGGEGGGELAEQQSIEWIEMVTPKVQLLEEADVIQMQGIEERLERVGFLENGLNPDTAGVPATDEQVTNWTRDKRTLNAKWFRLDVHLDYHARQESREPQNIGVRVRNMTLALAQRSLQQILLLSDTTDLSLNVRYRQITGLLAQASTRVWTPSTPVTMSDTVLETLYNSLPDEFMEDLPNMRFFMSRKMESAYGWYLKHNPTSALGNFVIQSQGTDVQGRMEFKGVPIKYLSYIPLDTVLLTHKDNIKIGFFVKMFLEEERDKDAGIDKYIMRLAMDAKFAHPEGVAKATNISTGVVALPNTE